MALGTDLLSKTNDFTSKITNAFGNVTKAYLCVRDVRGKDEDVKDNKNFEKDSEEVQKAILDAAAKKLMKGKTDVAGTAEDLFHKSSEAVLKNTKSGLSSSNKNLSKDELAHLMEGRYIPIEVQYNPSTLHYHSDLGGRRRISPVEGVGSGGDGMQIKDIPKNTELSCTLIFEKINVNDAFIQASEGWNASIGNIVSTVGNITDKLTKGSNSEKYSVRKEVEGFLSLLSTTYTRDVIFFYGKICFHGELTMVSANYKMFNKSGNPILAEVSIRIRQSSDDKYDQARWRTSFDELFNREEGQDGQNEQGEGQDGQNNQGFFGKAGSFLKDTGKNIGNAFSGGIF